MIIDLFTETFANTPTLIASIIAGAFIAQLCSRVIIDFVARKRIRRHKHISIVDERKRADTLASVFRTLAAVAIWLAAIITILTILEVDITALLTGAGLIGIIIGLGAQNTIKDFLAGVFIISENQYRVGDIVQLYAAGKDVAGVVEELTIRITKLRDLDGNLHVVKNGTAEVVSNLSYKYANVNIDVDVAYETDIDLVEKVINTVGRTMADSSDWREHVYEPIQFLRVDGFDGSSIRIKSLGKVEPAKQWEIAGEFRRRLKKAFEKEGITIPYQQIVIHQAPTKK